MHAAPVLLPRMPRVAAGEAVQVFLQKNKCSYCTYLSLSGWGKGWVAEGEINHPLVSFLYPKEPKGFLGRVFWILLHQAKVQAFLPPFLH